MTHRLAYRFANGRVKGYCGEGKDELLARKACMQQIHAALVALAESFDEGKVITVEEISSLTEKERLSIQKDWDAKTKAK